MTLRPLEVAESTAQRTGAFKRSSCGYRVKRWLVGPIPIWEMHFPLAAGRVQGPIGPQDVGPTRRPGHRTLLPHFLATYSETWGKFSHAGDGIAQTRDVGGRDMSGNRIPS